MAWLTSNPIAWLATRRSGIVASSLILSLLLVGGRLPAAEPEVAQLMEAAYARTQNATTADDYSAILRICQQAESRAVDQTHADYLNQLASWALNRRGEARVEQAAEAQGERASQLDALALEDFEQAVQRDPQRWRAIHNRGVSRALRGQFPEALKDFTRTIEINESYANAWYNRGEIQYEMGELEAAVADYNEAIVRKVDDPGMHASRGQALLQLGRHDEALEDYSRVVQLTPESADAYADRGDAYRSLGQWERAAADYRRAVALDQQSARAYQSAAWLMATCPDARFRNQELAIRAAERARELAAADDAETLDTLAAAHANAGEFKKAVAIQQAAVRGADGKQVEALRARLRLYENEKPFRQAAGRP